MRLRYIRYDLKHGFQKIKTRTALVLSTFALAIAGTGGLTAAVLGSAHATTPNWNLNGTYTFDFELGGSYVHDATISGQDGSGNFQINGGYPAGGAYSYVWGGTGTINGSDVTMSVDYSQGAIGTHMEMMGTVASNGTMSGTWTDNFGGTRNGTWSTATGHANSIPSQAIVTPTNTQGWATADSGVGGAVNYVTDSTAPGNPHAGALGLTTDATTTAKLQYLHAANIPLANVNELSYSTKQNSASFVGADASFQLPMCLNGVTTVCNGFTTLVYEPYQGGQGAVVPGTWQNWDIANGGHFWSSRPITCANGNVTGSAGGPAVYTLTAIKALCPGAIVGGFGVNVGSNNPSYNVEADLVDFNGTTFNFEPFTVATDKDACKDGGWANLKAADGSSFKNQGLCVSYVASGGKSQH